MKNPKTILAVLTLLVVSFTAGLFVGRNYAGSPMALSVPEEIFLPVPTASILSSSTNSEESDDRYPININTASMQELTALPGIGEGLAEDIVAYREANGVFQHPEELMNVSGIGENRLESILALITVGGIP